MLATKGTQTMKILHRLRQRLSCSRVHWGGVSRRLSCGKVRFASTSAIAWEASATLQAHHISGMTWSGGPQIPCQRIQHNLTHPQLIKTCLVHTHSGDLASGAYPYANPDVMNTTANCLQYQLRSCFHPITCMNCV
jgi:hypothetical protein